MMGEVMDYTGKMVSADNWYELVDKANMKDDQFILVWDESIRAYRKYDNHDLMQHRLDLSHEYQHDKRVTEIMTKYKCPIEKAVEIIDTLDNPETVI